MTSTASGGDGATGPRTAGGGYRVKEIDFDETGIGLVSKSGVLNDVSRLREEMVRLLRVEQESKNLRSEMALLRRNEMRELWERRNHPYRYAWKHTIALMAGKADHTIDILLGKIGYTAEDDNG